MTHTETIKGRKITYDCTCGHPGIEGNTCPTGGGDCLNCRYCKTEVSTADFWFLKEHAREVKL